MSNSFHHWSADEVLTQLTKTGETVDPVKLITSVPHLNDDTGAEISQMVTGGTIKVLANCRNGEGEMPDAGTIGIMLAFLLGAQVGAELQATEEFARTFGDGP